MPSRSGNFLLAAIINSPLHPVLGNSFAVIAVRGRRSGKTIRTPVNVARDGDTLRVISKRERTWWRNLRSGQSARLRLSGRNLQVRGEVVENAERVGEALARYFVVRPGYAKYFNVRLQPDGTPAADDLRAAAAGRVVIQLHEL
ncbi:MAG: nitroreductase/quinone reductase family protein [Chloroflexi bacterium]|nr:nitroreductase/quinone reductase family protein [Chloroflexota bacterium]